MDFFHFFSFRPLDERSKWSILLNILYFFDFLTSCWEVKLIDFTGYVDFSTFRPLAGRSNWLILLNILGVFDFLTFRAVGEMVRGQNDRCYWIYWFFSPFNIMVGGQNDRFYWIYWIFSTFRLFNLLVGVKMINFT